MGILARVNKVWLALLALLPMIGCGGGGSGGGVPSTPSQSYFPVPPASPPVVAALRMGYHETPWMESAAVAGALSDLKPGVVRINYPAFPLMSKNVDAAESTRLVGLIEARIVAVRSSGALPLDRKSVV